MSVLLLWMVVVPPVTFVLLYFLMNFFIPGKNSVCIVVLGDIGRSPRMQYHALSFAKENFNVDVIGYGGSKPHENFNKNELINVYILPEVPSSIKLLPRLLAYAVKVIWQATSLGVNLLLTPKSSHILVQNPPSIPTLAMVWAIASFRWSSVVIDWHNYGYTILGLTLGPQHPLVKFSKWFEKFFGRLASDHVCVTNAMREDLLTNWKIKANTVYDRAPLTFHETTLERQHNLFMELSKFYPVFSPSKYTESVSEERTKFTIKDESGQVKLLDDRPALLISSTSWTADEDFSILMTALDGYEKLCTENEKLPQLVCVITGKGLMKHHYQKELEQREWKNISYCLPWLEAEDYPAVLGCSDIGVCLHKSSSGLDLPMKVVDMFGCCLPVCAIHFNCISELVKHEENGYIFKDSDELLQGLQELLTDYRNNPQLEKFRSNLKEFQKVRWHENWKEGVLPIFTGSEKTLKQD